MSTLNELVRQQILAEGPDEYEGVGMGYIPTQERYIDHQLRGMDIPELLERISAALESVPRRGTNGSDGG